MCSCYWWPKLSVFLVMCVCVGGFQPPLELAERELQLGMGAWRGAKPETSPGSDSFRLCF